MGGWVDLVMIKRIIALLLFIGLAFLGCENNSPIADQTDEPADIIEKSSKRGLAFNLTHPDDFESLKEGVAWWYNWHWNTAAPENYYQDYQMEFIPMLWGGNTSDSDIENVKNFIISHPEVKYLLVMNEPNLIDQANRTPSQAAIDWLVYEQVKSDLSEQGRDIAIVGPAMNWGTMNDYWDPVVWLDAFYQSFRSIVGRDPIIDYLAFHWYDYGLEEQLDRLQKYGKQIWVTEMANWNPQIDSYQKQIDQMWEMVIICENRADVFRYAWFYGRGDLPDEHFSYIFNQSFGELSPLGNTYIDLPYTENQ